MKIICNSDKSVCKTRSELIDSISTNHTEQSNLYKNTSSKSTTSYSADDVVAVAAVGYGLYKLFGGGNDDSSSYVSSNYSDISYVMVEAQCIAGFSPCIEKDLQITGGPGEFSPNYNSASSGAIHKGYNGLAGSYNFRVQFDNNICSGSFYLSGEKKNYSINLGRDCHDNGSREW